MYLIFYFKMSQCNKVIFQADGEEVNQILQNFQDVNTTIQEYKLRLKKLKTEKISKNYVLTIFFAVVGNNMRRDLRKKI